MFEQPHTPHTSERFLLTPAVPGKAYNCAQTEVWGEPIVVPVGGRNLVRSEANPLVNELLKQPYEVASSLLCERVSLRNIDIESVQYLMHYGQKYIPTRNHARNRQRYEQDNIGPMDISCQFILGKVATEVTFAPLAWPTLGVAIRRAGTNFTSNNSRMLARDLLQIMHPAHINTITMAALSENPDAAKYLGVLNPYQEPESMGGEAFRAFIAAKEAIYGTFPLHYLTGEAVHDQYSLLTGMAQILRLPEPHIPVDTPFRRPS